MWRTKPTDRFALRWIKLRLSAPLTLLLSRLPWLHPAHVTILAAALGVTGGVLFALGCAWQAGCVAAVGQVLDGVDGQLARRSGRATPGGAFWDSVLDRYADGALLAGLTVYLARLPGFGSPALWIALGLLALIGSSQISYTSARAATLGLPLGAPTLASKGTRASAMILSAWATLLWDRAPVVALAYIATHTSLEVLRRLARTRPGRTRAARAEPGAVSTRGEAAAVSTDAGQSAPAAPKASPLAETGVIHGRFQVLHHDHLRYLLAGKALCRHLVVGVTNPDPTLTRPEPEDPHRSAAAANPLSYYERQQLVRAALEEVGVPAGEYTIVPFPINVPELYAHYAPLDAVFFLTIYDEWGRRKLRRFEELGLRTHVLWEREEGGKGISGTEVRRRMARGEPWRDLVPASVAALLERWGVPERLRRSAEAAPPPDSPGIGA